MNIDVDELYGTVTIDALRLSANLHPIVDAID
ncbi:hypothetical protein BBM1340_07295 [Bifidobacterium breve MCC 1340]|jgi:hypothetical protein|nr:hypothetical protein BBM1340_07295 [Bifidobacterium breve MCC 1340]